MCQPQVVHHSDHTHHHQQQQELQQQLLQRQQAPPSQHSSYCSGLGLILPSSWSCQGRCCCSNSSSRSRSNSPLQPRSLWACPQPNLQAQHHPVTLPLQPLRDPAAAAALPPGACQIPQMIRM